MKSGSMEHIRFKAEMAETTELARMMRNEKFKIGHANDQVKRFKDTGLPEDEQWRTKRNDHKAVYRMLQAIMKKRQLPLF